MESQPTVLCDFTETGLYHYIGTQPVMYRILLPYHDDLSFQHAKQYAGLFITILSFS